MRFSLIASLLCLNSLAIASVVPILDSSIALLISGSKISYPSRQFGFLGSFPSGGSPLESSSLAFGIGARVRASNSAGIWRINFQPKRSCVVCWQRFRVPNGYVADTGAAYDPNVGYGWVTEDSAGAATPEPFDISNKARARNIRGYDGRLKTLLHMDKENAAAAWEIDLESGDYLVTLGVGDGDKQFLDSVHSINIEGLPFISPFIPNEIQHFELATGIVTVSDGRLTVDSLGGENTKINFIEIKPSPFTAESPTIIDSAPKNREAGVNIASAINLDLALTVSGIDSDTINSETVKIFRTNNGQLVEGIVNTSGGGDAIVFQPIGEFERETHYTVQVSGVMDEGGNEFIDFITTFSTGSDTIPNFNEYFSRTQVATGIPAMSLVVGPDREYLYATTNQGTLVRWQIDPDTGFLKNIETLSHPILLGDDPQYPRTLIGIVFDLSNPNIIWVSSNDSIFSEASDNFTSKISRVELVPDVPFEEASVSDFIVGLPVSTRDHLSNSLVFNRQGNLLLTQGSLSATGAPDAAWGRRSETLLSAAILKIDVSQYRPGETINVQTEDYITNDGVRTYGNYDPFVPGAAVSIYAAGIRNAYDLVPHSNRFLYAPTNGSAAGGSTPDDPITPTSEERNSLGIQNDHLYRIEEGGYYGHPNPSRNQFILNGGNPTPGEDPLEVPEYSVGTLPEPNFRGIAHDFGRNRSPNGAIEYQSNIYGGYFQGKILVTEYSGGDDIVGLEVNESGDVVDSFQFLSGFSNPLEIAEDPESGRIYVVEYGSWKNNIDDSITMLEAIGEASAAEMVLENLDGWPSSRRIVFNAIDDTSSDPSLLVRNESTLRIHNRGKEPLAIDTLHLDGPWEFVDPDFPSSIKEIAPGDFLDLRLRFVALQELEGLVQWVPKPIRERLFPQPASELISGSLTIESNFFGEPIIKIELIGFRQNRPQGKFEPTLAQIVELFGYSTTIENQGESVDTGGEIVAIGDEALSPYWQRADRSKEVTVIPIAQFRRWASTRLEWFEKGNPNTTYTIFRGDPNDIQTLMPNIVDGSPNFTPLVDAEEVAFGFRIDGDYSDSEQSYATSGHFFRFYPLEIDGDLVLNTYIMAYDYTSINFDYQDVVFIVQNVQPMEKEDAPLEK